MCAARQDRRTRYTKMVLRESLKTLMVRKPLAKITVKELCEQADVNRCTFYRYYRDPYDLLHQIEDEIIEEINSTLAAFYFQYDTGEAFQAVEKIFQYIADNSDFCRLLLSEAGDVAFQKRVMVLFQQRYLEEWKARRNTDPETGEYLYLFVVNGSVGIVQNWLKTGMRKTPREMAELLLRLSGQGLAGFE